MDGWMGGWMEVKAGLRIAYSNQKCGLKQIVTNNYVPAFAVHSTVECQNPNIQKPNYAKI